MNTPATIADTSTSVELTVGAFACSHCGNLFFTRINADNCCGCEECETNTKADYSKIFLYHRLCRKHERAKLLKQTRDVLTRAQAGLEAEHQRHRDAVASCETEIHRARVAFDLVRQAGKGGA